MSELQIQIVTGIISSCRTLPMEGKKIAVITIPKDRDKPYQTTDGKYLIRVGTTNRVATQPELLRLFQASGVFHYDLASVPRTSMKDLNLTRLDNHFQRYEVDFSHESEDQKRILLRNTDILSESGEVTLGGLLIFGTNPSRYLTQNGISFARFQGKALDEKLIDKQSIDGNLSRSKNNRKTEALFVVPPSGGMVRRRDIRGCGGEVSAPAKAA